MFDAEIDILYVNSQNPTQAATDSEVTNDVAIITLQMKWLA